MSLSVRTNLPTFIGLFLVFGLPLIFSFFLKSKYRKSGLFSGIVVHHWSIVFLLFILITLWEHQSLSSIGFRGFSYREILWGFAGFFVGAFSFALTTPLVRALHLNTTAGGITRLAAAPPGLRVVLVLTAGIAEEIMFRGYAIERLATLIGSVAVGAAIAYLVFVALHLPFWGPGGTIQIGVWSLLVTVLYVWQRNLWPCILMHVLNDAYAFIVLPMFFTQYLHRS